MLLVCPGPLRATTTVFASGRTGQAAARGSQTGGGVKTNRISPDVLAKKILRACEHRRRELIVPWSARIIFTLMQTNATLADWWYGSLT